MKKIVTSFLVGIITCALFSAFIFFSWSPSKMSKIHKLEFPLLLEGEEATNNFHLLPKGTTLYFDKAYPEGFTRYKVYINIDRLPLKLEEINDPTSILPIEAHVPNKEDLTRLLNKYPLTKSDLGSILRSGQLSKEEIKEVFEDFNKSQK